MYAIILAGGSGTRLQPLSHPTLPKQFLHFGRPYSLLQETIRRLLPAFAPENIFILTHQDYERLVYEHITPIHKDLAGQILLEPVRKNTAPALALAVKHLQEKCGAKPTDCFLVCPSDHLFSSPEPLLTALPEAHAAAQTGAHVLFGIKPRKPDTQFGYIKTAPSSPSSPSAVLSVEEFVEKPDLETAKRYLASPNYLWNAGIFCFQVKSFLEELAQYCPALIENDFVDMPSISIDYALMQHTKRAKVIPLTNVIWADMGSWESVYEAQELYQFSK